MPVALTVRGPTSLKLTLASTSGVALCKQLADQLADAIHRGELQPGAPLPPLRELARHLALSPQTVRQAYAALTTRGLVTSLHRRGHFVSVAPSLAESSEAAPIGTVPSRISQTLDGTAEPAVFHNGFPGLVGGAGVMATALRLLDRVANNDATVLLTGETGTGKDVFALALHEAGLRRAGPFVTVDCTAIPAPLFEAELFGAMRGSFTGAVQDRVGLAVAATGGTLFLDEIGDMPAELQPKLLRVIEQRRVRPVGASHETHFDARVVAATHRDLPREIAAGRFRADLYFRLNVVEIHIPPLRDRVHDLPALCRHLLDRFGRADQRVGPAAEQILAKYDWPGNIRELGNELQRASLLADIEPIERKHLSPKVQGGPFEIATRKGTLAERLDAVRRGIVIDTLRDTHGNRTAAAKALGITREGLHGLMARLHIK